MLRSRLTFTIAFALLIIVGCASQSKFIPPPQLQDDRMDVPYKPASVKINIVFDTIDKITAQQLKESLDFSRQLRHLSGSSKGALNVGPFGEVSNSSWFTNRNALKQMSLSEIVKGADKGDGPDITGLWQIIRAKSEGITPGFTIKDSRGDTYLIKFDPKGYSELVTGAEVISTKLFYAAGYNTPENYLTFFHPDSLAIAENVKYIDPRGKTHFMRQEDLAELLEKVNILPDGRIRAVASKYVPGKPIGPFKYQSRRKDDPNDFIPHQHRRELRGLYVIAAWLKHTDTKDGNSLDSYVTENGKSYVRHFLIDFGSTLGSAARGPFKPESGHLHHIDLNSIFWNYITLGLFVRDWEKNTEYKFNSIGRFRSDLFKPHKFKNNSPNPAFDLMTDLDGYWGAKLVLSFTDQQLEAVVKTARYSDPNAESYLLKTLIERRDIIGRKWFGIINPLDNFDLKQNLSGAQSLYFEDLANSTHLEDVNSAKYKYTIKLRNNILVKGEVDGNNRAIDIPGDISAMEDGQLEIKIHTERNGKQSKWINVYLNYNDDTKLYSIIGLKRQG